MAITTGIVGAAGFAGTELVRLIDKHPNFELHTIVSDSLAGKALSDVYPAFSPDCDLVFSARDSESLYECDAVFLAVPHTAAMSMVPSLLDKGIAVFDLSADFRLRDVSVYEKWYETQHTAPSLLEHAVFGLPELFRADLESAATSYIEKKPVLVACAGCYPTASSLAAYPAIDAGLVQGTVIIDAISGISGAGKSMKESNHFCFANENLAAYGLTKHRHTPEIEQILGIPGQLIFSPHLAPLSRGILATVYLPLKESGAEADLQEYTALYQSFYADDPFIEVLPEGGLPQTSTVRGTNYAKLGLAFQKETRTLIVVSAIDNLCKGAAGQALQCANLVFGLPETQGLEVRSWYV